MVNFERRGTVAIRPGDENQAPAVVYVGGRNGFGFLICRVLNESSLLFSEPEDNDLLDFDMKVFEKMSKEWRIQNLKNQLDALTKEMKDAN